MTEEIAAVVTESESETPQIVQAFLDISVVLPTGKKIAIVCLNSEPVR